MDLSKKAQPSQQPIADLLASMGIKMQLIQHNQPQQPQQLQPFDPSTMNLPNGTVNPMYLLQWYNMVNQQLQYLQTSAMAPKVAHPPMALPDCDPITRDLVMDAFTMQGHNFKGPMSQLEFKSTAPKENPIMSPDGYMIRFTKCRDIITRCGANALSPQDRQFYDTYQSWLNSVSPTLDPIQQEHLHKLHQKTTTQSRKQEGYQKGWQTRRGKKERMEKKKQGNEDEGKEEILLA